MKAVRERIAAAPISWGVSEVPSWGHQMSPQRVFDEMRSLGFQASELGPNGYFANDKKVADALKADGFSIIAGFVPVTFRFPDGLHDEEEKLHDTFARLSGSGAVLAVLAVAGEDSDYESRASLSERQWDRVADGIDRVVEIASTHGLSTVVHPHYGTLVETIMATQELLDRSDVGLCLDTVTEAAQLLSGRERGRRQEPSSALPGSLFLVTQRHLLSRAHREWRTQR